MQPQTLPTPGYTPYQPPDARPRRQRGTALWFLITIIAVVLAAGGVWFWQQQNVSSLSRTNADLTKQLGDARHTNTNNTDDSQTISFGESKVPFTFSYPSSWMLSSDAPILYNKDLPVSYSITLAAPGTINTQTPTNGSAVTAGALINIAVLPAPTNDVKDLVPKAEGSTTPVASTTVTANGLTGVRYQLADEQPRVYTDFIKDRVRYSIVFEAKDSLTSNEHYAAYQALITSFKLK